MCVLCRDTFSRSDILKRHFQKCSIRRGNPTGASHLSHAQAHLKKSHPGPHKGNPSMTMSNDNDMMPVNGMGSMDPALQPFGVIADGSVPDAGSNMTDDQAAQEQLLQSNAQRYSTDGGRNGGQRNQGYGGQMSNPMGPGMNSPLAFSIPNGQNNHSYSQTTTNYNYANNGAPLQPSVSATLRPNGQHHSSQTFLNTSTSQQTPLEWSPMFQSPTQDRFTPTYHPNISNSQVAIKSEPTLHNGNFIKSEPTASSDHFAGVYPGVPHSLNFPSWNFQNDPLQKISNQLLSLCFPPNSPISPRNADLQKYLSVDNIKHFLEHFSSFHGHYP